MKKLNKQAMRSKNNRVSKVTANKSSYFQILNIEKGLG